MSTAHPIRSVPAGHPPLLLQAKMYEAYFATLEAQARRFETVASKLKDENSQAILDIVAGFRQEAHALREQIERFAEWG